tara:strand:+ start:31068 stop:31958 length:891 start_codon:yes stop_codon:yes gene_type:complete
MRVALLCGLLCAWFPLAGAEVRVATMNLRNYLVQDRMVDGRWRTNHPKPETEKLALAKAVVEIAPDILAMQEMGPGPFLREFATDLKAAGVDYPYAVLMEADDPDRHLALLSRIPPVEVIQHDDLEFPYEGERIPVKRGLLEVIFPFGEADGQTWSLFVVHLKSRWSDVAADPLSSERRTKEAQAIRNRILDRFPDGVGRYLIVGDFNDHRSSSTVRRFLSRGSVSISRIVESYDSRGETWTFYYGKKDLYERVDFILSSAALAPFLSGNEGTVFDLQYIRKGTDHRPVYVDLELP